MQAERLEVVFRKFPEGDIIALFCNSGAYCREGYVISYQHFGQHAPASQGLAEILAPVQEHEYLPLKRELESVYKCEIIPVEKLVS